MTDQTRRLFEELEPPPGGLASLRARIETDHRRQRRLRVVMATAVTIVGLVVGVFYLQPPTPTATMGAPTIDLIAGAQNDPGLIALGLAPLPSETVTVRSPDGRRAATQHVPTTNDDVVFYLFGTVR